MAHQDIAALAGICAEIDAELTALGQRASSLTDYAWKHRYPAEPDEPDRAEAESALALAREVYVAIISRLPGDVHPEPPANSSQPVSGV
jgi:hypothetical protein